MSDTLIEALTATARFQGCSSRELTAISRICTLLTVPAGRALVRDGRPGHEFGIVLHGRARVSFGDTETGVLTAGDLFGAAALLDAGPSLVRVTALTPMVVAVAGRPEFDVLLANCPTIAHATWTEDNQPVEAQRRASQPPSVNRNVRDAAPAPLSATARSTQKSLPSGSASHTQPDPSSLR